MGFILEFSDAPASSVFNLPPETAIDFFKSKGLRPTFSYLDMVREEHDVAFTVAKMLQVDLLNTVQKSLDTALAEGWSIQRFRQSLTPILQSAGWWGKADVLDPFGNLVPDAQLGSAHRLNTIYRSNLQSAYSVGQWERIDEDKDRAPWLMYDAVDDHRTREEHDKLRNIVLRVSDPFWHRFMPPNGYNCRCGVIQLTDDDLERLGLKPSRPPVIETIPWKNPRTGEIEHVPVAIDPGWDHNPGLNRLEHLKKLGREKLRALPAGIRPSDSTLVPEREFFEGKSREMEWHRAAFDSAPRALKMVVQGAARIEVQQTPRSGAWAQAGRRIEMGSYSTDDAQGRGTWRHEFGHILDVQLGNREQGWPYFSGSEAWHAARDADAKRMKEASGKGRRSKALEQRQAKRAAEYEAVREAAIRSAGDGFERLLMTLAEEAGASYAGFIRAMRRETILFPDERQPGALGAGARARLAEALVALTKGDPEHFVAMLLFRDLGVDGFAQKRQAYRRAEVLGMLSDLAGATTMNKVAGYHMGFPGHSDSYYRRSPYARGTEAFANITALMGHEFEFWHLVVRMMAPNQVAEWDALIGRHGDSNE